MKALFIAAIALVLAAMGWRVYSQHAAQVAEEEAARKEQARFVDINTLHEVPQKTPEELAEEAERNRPLGTKPVMLELAFVAEATGKSKRGKDKPYVGEVAVKTASGDTLVSDTLTAAGETLTLIVQPGHYFARAGSFEQKLVIASSEGSKQLITVKVPVEDKPRSRAASGRKRH